jgi:diacylglycerol kinase (ATP)
MSWLNKRWKSFGHAWHGVVILVQGEPHARLHALATLLVAGLGVWLDLSRQDWQALVLVVALVWLAEGMNTALEYLCDAAVPQQHPLIGKAKDVAAGAVLICALFALLMAGLIFGPYLAP